MQQNKLVYVKMCMQSEYLQTAHKHILSHADTVVTNCTEQVGQQDAVEGDNVTGNM